MLLNVAAEIIISLDSQGDITLLNESGHRILGYEAHELVGKNWFDTCLPVEERKENEHYFELLLKGESTSLVTHESNVVTKNGERRTILWHNALRTDKEGKGIGLLISGEDITERKRMEESLRNSAKRLEGIIEGTHVGTWEWNVQTEEANFNSLWAEMIGYTLEELAPLSIQTWIKNTHPDDLEKAQKMLSQHFSGKKPFYEFEFRMRHKDGHWVWVLDRGKVITWTKDGKPLMMFGTHTDITALKSDNERTRTLLLEKELILKEVHHRIKNSMNTVSSLLSLQASKTSEPTAMLALEDAKNRIQSMSLLYDKLYRAQDYTELSVKDYLSSLVDEVVENFPNSQMVKVEKNFQDFPLDIKRLQSIGIMINELITNIMKYAFRDRETGTIRVSTTKQNSHVSIFVQDDGIGIPESISFENSAGFGLQLVYALAEQLNASINMERSNGTTVVFEFEI